MRELDFFFDFLSPFSYLAWCNFKEKLPEWQNKQLVGKVSYYPIPMGMVFARHETKGPAQIDSKREFLLKQIIRYCRQRDIPFYGPKELPFNPLPVLRLATACNAKENQFALIDLLFRMAWATPESPALDDPQVLSQLIKAEGLPNSLMEGLSDRTTKKEVKENLEYALQNGVFGVPTFVLGEELFWGNDSIDYLELFLEDKDCLDRELFEAISKRTLVP